MANENLTKEDEVLKLTDWEIFTKIWTSPRLVFKFINEYRYDKFITMLLVLAGITATLNRAASKGLGDQVPLFVVLIIGIIAGAIFGWISYYIYAALISWTGKWLKGQGNTTSLLRMISYATIPSIIVLILYIPKIILFGNGIFQRDFDVFESGNGILYEIIYLIFLLIEIVLGVWTLVIFVIGISEVQKISIGKSILNLILPAMVIFIPLGMIAFIVGDFFK